MSCSSEVHVGDVGTSLRATIYDQNDRVIDVSSSTSIVYYLEKPSGAILTKTGSYVTNGTDGIVQYVTEVGDIDETGIWKLQVTVIFSGSRWTTNIHRFKVQENLV